MTLSTKRLGDKFIGNTDFFLDGVWLGVELRKLGKEWFSINFLQVYIFLYYLFTYMYQKLRDMFW